MNLLGPYLAACAVLVLAGAAKAWRPHDTARAVTAAFGSVGMPAATAGVRVLAGLELVVGLAALVFPSKALAGVVAASYLVFTGFVVVVRRRGGPLASCGCFATPDTPATATHAVVTAGLAAAALGVAATLRVSGHPVVTTLVAHQAGRGLPLLGVSGVLAGLVVVALVELPRLEARRRAIRRPSQSGVDEVWMRRSAGFGSGPAAVPVPVADPVRSPGHGGVPR